MIETMRPCPFCGGRSQRVKDVWKTWRFVACDCKAAGAPAKTDELAIANWNNRSVDRSSDDDELYGLRCTIGRYGNMIRSLCRAAESGDDLGLRRLARECALEVGEGVS